MKQGNTYKNIWGAFSTLCSSFINGKASSLYDCKKTKKFMLEIIKMLIR